MDTDRKAERISEATNCDRGTYWPRTTTGMARMMYKLLHIKYGNQFQSGARSGHGTDPERICINGHHYDRGTYGPRMTTDMARIMYKLLHIKYGNRFRSGARPGPGTDPELICINGPLFS